MPPSVDLHSHSNLSDGQLSPQELVRLAAENGVEVLAVTDHDTTEGIGAACAEAATHGMRIIPGMEVSAHVDRRGIHILGYFGMEALPQLEVWQAERRRSRHRRVETMVTKLAELGVPVELEAVLKDADPRRSPGRPQVAQALIEAGHVETMQEAFERFLGRDKPAFVATKGPDAAEAIELIHSLPGLAVVAHPGLDGHDARLRALADLGLDGAEAFHGGHTPGQAQAIHSQARALGLLVTGGSDFHGFPSEEAERPVRLGSVPWPQEEWERFQAAYEGVIQ